MNRTHVITGSASGIGKATADRLIAKGHRVIGVDINNADIVCDLGTKGGRAEVVKKVKELSPIGIDGLLTSAGSSDSSRPGFVVATNYFGTIDLIEGLYPLFRKPGARCVTVSSLGMHVADENSEMLQDACLAGDEEKAIKIGDKEGFITSYSGTKKALTVWSRRTAVKPEWASAGVLLNIVAPGIIYTPMTERAMANPEVWAKIQKTTPCAVGEYAQAKDVAELMDFLMNCKTNHLVGQLFHLDSGSEAITRQIY